MYLHLHLHLLLHLLPRNFVGWPRWSSTLPNPAHLALAAWEAAGRLQGVVTQNVDQLHYKVRPSCFLTMEVS